MNRPGRYIVPLLLLALGCYFLFAVHHVLLPFILAAALAYLLHPIVKILEVRGLRHRAAAGIVFLSFMALCIGVFGVTVSMASDQISRVASDMPTLVKRLQEFIQAGHWHHKIPALEKFMETGGLSHGWLATLWSNTPTVALKVLPIFELTFLVPFLAFLFMMDGITLRDALLEVVPARYVEMCLSVLVEIDNSLGAYMRGMLLQAAFLGIFTGLGFSVIGLNYAVPIGLWVAATSMIPLIGAISAAIVGAAVALIQWGTLSGLVKVLVIATVIRLIDDWFLHPMILRRAVHMHPAVTVFSLMAGASLAGFWGLLFAVPVVCMIKVLLEVLWEWYRSEYGLQRLNPVPEVSHIPLI